LFAASDITQVRKIKLPPNDTPYDIKVNGDWCYVLTNERLCGNAKEECQVKIWKSKNLQDGTAIFSFKVESFVRSFEILNGDFYFGVGCNASNLSKATGNILRIKKPFKKNPKTLKWDRPYITEKRVRDYSHHGEKSKSLSLLIDNYKL
jgi:hypothetical protein